ncbi:MAG: hypothetical protein ACE5MG_06200 [Candidatus Methylomirabilales bacterium]
MRRLLREGAGLTIPEVLLSAVIISVAILALVGLFPTALQNVQYGGHMSQALSLGQEMIEMIRTQPFLTVSSYNGLDTGTTPGPLPPSVQSHYDQWKDDIVPAIAAGALPQGRGTIQVTDNALGFADLKQLTVTVTWRERGTQTITLVTYVARHD